MLTPNYFKVTLGNFQPTPGRSKDAFGESRTAQIAVLAFLTEAIPTSLVKVFTKALPARAPHSTVNAILYSDGCQHC